MKKSNKNKYSEFNQIHCICFYNSRIILLVQDVISLKIGDKFENLTILDIEQKAVGNTVYVNVKIVAMKSG
ncbi:hypothetical protein KK424_00660 [Clostridioides difficile]|nr:hypothetical protein [Clostridioides difficile]